jgi:hypothetical protein
MPALAMSGWTWEAKRSCVAGGKHAGNGVASGVLRGPGVLCDADMSFGMSSRGWEAMGVLSGLGYGIRKFELRVGG